MPRPLGFWDDETRAEHYLARAERRGECLCLGNSKYPTWRCQQDDRTKKEPIARLICRVFHGEQPTGSIHLHSCDNKTCINPEHLSWGTQSQNIKDAYAKGLMVGPSQIERLHDDEHWLARLKVSDVLIIRKRLAAKETVVAVAASFGVHEETIRRIKTRRAWAHLPEQVGMQ
jgi:HNH endonuclease